MYDDDEHTDDYGDRPARRMRPFDLLLLPMVLLHNVLEAVSDWLTDTVLLVTAHAKWKIQQESPVKVTQ